MKAMILAAGKGTRLREITKGKIPKPMVDLGPGPLLEHTLNLLLDHNLVDELVINTHTEPETITDHFGEEYRGAKVDYSYEEELLGTAGGVKNVEEKFNDTFIVFYGDILTDIDLEKMVEEHRRKGADATILAYEEDSDSLSEASIIVTDGEGFLTEFIEKPSENEISRFDGKDFLTNAGIYILEPEMLEVIPEGFSDFSKDIFPRAIEKGMDIYAYRLPKESYWHEVGNPGRYRKAVEDIDKGKIDFREG
ncbi:MAG: NDP-sugar synthase [Candidatus Nanohaloarchaea archaeon]